MQKQKIQKDEELKRQMNSLRLGDNQVELADNK